MSHTLSDVIIGTMLLTFGYFPLELLSGRTWYFRIKKSFGEDTVSNY